MMRKFKIKLEKVNKQLKNKTSLAECFQNSSTIFNFGIRSEF